MKPGITGVASIIFRDEIKIIQESKIPWDKYVKEKIMPHKAILERWYSKNQSFKTDLLLIFCTFIILINKKSKMIYRLFKDIPQMNK